MAETSRKPLQAHSTKSKHVTSIGLKHAPKNKHKRRQWKKYRAQGWHR